MDYDDIRDAVIEQDWQQEQQYFENVIDADDRDYGQDLFVE